MVRVRMAPSPTGMLHMGTALMSFINVRYASTQNGVFVLRFEDTDRSRSTKESEQIILDGLSWLGLMDNVEGIQADGSEVWSYGPYRQTERMDRYQEYVQKLRDNGYAYHCYMTEAELEAQRKEQEARGEPPRYTGQHRNLTKEQKSAYEAEGRKPVIRFRIPDTEEIVYNDLVRGEIRFDTSLIGDFVIMRSDGMPLYNIANVVDDHEMQISHIIRAEDHIPNTPKQILLYQALGLTPPEFGHISLILTPERKKLSKRESQAADIMWLRDQGYLPEAVINMLGLLNWNPGEGDTREFFSKQELLQEFSLNRVSKSGSVFDIEKLNHVNAHYIKECETTRLTDLCTQQMIKHEVLEQNRDTLINPHTGEPMPENSLQKLVNFLRTKMRVTKDIIDDAKYIFRPQHLYNPELFENPKMGIDKETAYKNLEWVQSVLEAIDIYTVDHIKPILVDKIKEAGLKNGPVLWPLRVALTGEENSLGALEVLELLGKETSMQHIENAKQALKNT